MKKPLIFSMIIFVLVCSGLIVQALVTHPSGTRGPFPLLQQTTQVDTSPQQAQMPVRPTPQVTAPSGRLTAIGREDDQEDTILLGSTEKTSDYHYQLELTSKGAAVQSATFSHYLNRDRKNPQGQTFLSPAQVNDTETVYSLANQGFDLLDQGQRLRLDRLDWRLIRHETDANGLQTAEFEATIISQDAQPVVVVRKTFRVRPESYLFDLEVAVENVSSAQQQFAMDMAGPVGLEQEAFRRDMRNALAAYRNPNGEIVSFAPRRISRAKPEDLMLSAKNAEADLLWVAAINKYFAAIVVPQAAPSTDNTNWLSGHTAVFYDPDNNPKQNDGRETVGLNLRTAPTILAPQDQQTFAFQIYLGPKDKSLFDKDETFRSLGFVHTINFISCCCPQSIIAPLAFAILALMKGMYAVIHNYGIVIIILVLVMRLLLHPVTKKSQVSMHKMSKLAPKAEEIKKKYGNNKAEMNRRMMELYKEQGASPVMGFLPMLIQMPIWIALWSAINASVDLRAKGFLPFWITDLSVPDALITFSSALKIPLLGVHVHGINALPILMGLAFYLQQKLMPMQAAAASNPQMAQQQKMMSVMMPILFPLMLYSVPSGVNLYIMTSTALGVWEQHVIRKHIREKEEEEAVGLVPATSKTGGKGKKKKPKPMYKQFR